MRNSILVKTTLTLSSLIAIGVGFGILFVPHAFHASAGLLLGNDTNLLNEMRAPGGLVLVSGLFILLGAIRAEMAFFAMALSSTVYLTYGFSRVVSLLFDGVPNSTMLQIMALELFIGAFCAIMLKTSKAPC